MMLPRIAKPAKPKNNVLVIRWALGKRKNADRVIMPRANAVTPPHRITSRSDFQATYPPGNMTMTWNAT